MINQESSNFFRQLLRNCLRKLRILAKFPSPSTPAICLVFESFSGNLCVIAFKVTRLLIQILAQFCIEKSIPTSYELFSDTYMPFSLPILYQKAFVELFPTPFPAKKALLPHMSLSVLVTCLLLAPFSIRKTLLPHKSSFLLISGTFLAAFSIRKAFLPHMSFFLLVTCH